MQLATDRMLATAQGSEHDRDLESWMEDSASSMADNDGCEATGADVRVEDIGAEDWDRLVLEFDDAVQEQLQSFNEVRRAPEQLRRLAVYANGEPVGGILLRLVKVPVLGLTISSSRWGPVWRRSGKAASIETLEMVLRAVTDEVCRRNKGSLMIMPRPDPDFQDAPVEALQRIGFRGMAPLANPLRYFARVDLSPDDLRANFSQKWRYNLKKAEAAGLKTELVEGEAGLQEILDLYHEMLARKKFVDYSPIDTLAHRLSSPLERLRPRMFVTRKDGVPLAMAVVDCCGDTASYLYGATADDALPTRAGYALQWGVLRHLSHDPAMRWYALGGAGSATGPLHQFKRGLVGKAGVILDERPAHIIASGRYEAAVGRLVMAVRDTRDRLREPLAQLLPVRFGR
ncbi:MAG: hypothetical protein CML67_16290 [Rhodobacteraceae bacterium]|nr:hypothetical protein [Paracoccaceae bacterium]